MPEITDTTPREEYTIAGETFSIPLPYSAGMTLSPNEAAALNQTWAENARNNFAKRVKDAQEAGTFDLQVFQGSLDDYLSEYEFGVRSGGGGRTGDPVKAEAIDIARGLVRKALIKAGHKLKDVPAKKVTELANAVLAKGDDKSTEIFALAKQRVEAAKDVTDIELDLGGAEEESAPQASSKKAKAEAAA